MYMHSASSQRPPSMFVSLLSGQILLLPLSPQRNLLMTLTWLFSTMEARTTEIVRLSIFCPLTCASVNGSEYLPNIYEILKQPVGLDRFNNYEVVYLREATSKRDISIQVKAFSVSVGPQPYSMVVTRHVARGSCASASAAGPAKSFVTDGSALLAQGNAVLSDTFVQPAPLPTGYAVPN